MKTLVKSLVLAITLILQFILAYLLLFFALSGLGGLLTSTGLATPQNPNVWWQQILNFLTMMLSASLGVWGAGRIFRRFWEEDFDQRKQFLGAFIGSLLGVLAILLSPATGFIQILYPVLGALLGYYFARYFLQVSDFTCL